MPQETPPQASELEVTLIGPHVGESVLLHYQESWFLIDSCMDTASGKPAALNYLTALGVPADRVRIVASTHWHDDHFKGLSALYESFPHASFWMSQALGRKEFLEVVEAWRGWPAEAEPHTSGLQELTNCIDIARQRGIAPNFAGPNQRMWLAADGSAELWSLSPSPEMILKSLTDIAKLMPSAWSAKNAAADAKPNHTSVAMHFRAGDHSVLLGSDLEEENDPLTGWSAILASAARPQQKATLYKVAHHGSATGHHDGIWTELLRDGPISILTPYTRSRLPRDGDVQRLKENSSRVLISARRAPIEVKRSGTVAKRIKGNKLKVVNGAPGMVRCRVNTTVPGAGWTIELFGPAQAL